MKTWPDETDKPKVVNDGPYKGSIENYWPPKTKQGIRRLTAYNAKAAAVRYATHPIDDDGWTEWIKPARGYRMRCCDCRLVHEVEFRVGDDGVVRMRVRRHARATAASRRKRG